ncbi:MAG: hypothetical protein ACRDUY_10755 [Nitriliruptorales bacterium]
MRAFAMVLGVLLVVAGGIWALQGLNVAFAPQSLMTGNRQWVIYGLLTVVVGLGLVVGARRS